MARVYMTSSSIPELRPLSREQRIQVLRAAGAVFGKTPVFRRFRRLYFLLSALPIAVWIVGYYVFGDGVIGLIPAVVVGLIGYQTWNQFLIEQLRPFIREVLKGPIPDTPAPKAEQWLDDPWRYIPTASLFFGGFMAVVMLLTDNLPWWVVLPLNLVVGLLFGTATWFAIRYMKGR
jgi:hypothetical protein